MIADIINGPPTRLGNIISNYEKIDLVTPNQLHLVRNNDHSPAATMKVPGKSDRILKENRKIFNSWFEAALFISYVPRLTNHAKWFSTGHDIKTCEVVIFLKQDGVLSNSYQYGMINEIVPTEDGVILFVRYRNHQ